MQKADKIYISCAILVSLILWIAYKHYYYYPNLTFDSYHYLMNMHLNTNAAGWPVGYSKFLKLVGSICYSANFLVTLQYFIIQVGFLLFFISIRYFFGPPHWISILLLLFLFVNPLIIFESNHILSDALYIGFFMIWVSQLLWIIFRFKPFMAFTQALLLLILFDLRYNSLYLPLITLTVFIISRIHFVWKLLGITLSTLFLVIFIQYTRINMEKMCGIRQYAYSNGWKQASNSLYIYEHYYKTDNKKKPVKFRELDSLVRDYFNKPHPNVSLFYPDQEITLGSYYMAVGGTPLYSYMQKKSGYTDWSLDFHRTAPYGGLYREYGNYIISQYPFGYFKYVVYPHMLSYLTPYPEIFTENPQAFMLWNDNEYGKVARDWFKLSTLKIPDKYINFRSWILSPYPIFYSFIHIAFLFSFIPAILLKVINKVSKNQLSGVIILSLTCFGNFLFTVLSTTSVLRYQPAVIVLEFTLFLLFIGLCLISVNKKIL